MSAHQWLQPSGAREWRSLLLSPSITSIPATMALDHEPIGRYQAWQGKEPDCCPQSGSPSRLIISIFLCWGHLLVSIHKYHHIFAHSERSIHIQLLQICHQLSTWSLLSPWASSQTVGSYIITCLANSPSSQSAQPGTMPDVLLSWEDCPSPLSFQVAEDKGCTAHFWAVPLHREASSVS